MKRFLVLVSLFLLVSCGVRPTEIVRAGPAPILPAGGEGAVLYFLSGEQLQPASRATGQPLAPAQAVELLLGGPTDAERSAGLVTKLPFTSGRVTLSGTTLTMPIPVLGLPEEAVQQLVCTAVRALAPTEQHLGLFLAGRTGPLGYRECSAMT
ncbi:hypothetical protein GCM10022247_27260 [Allokutzneria multivorans]|uniref:GerMN domain-containing protein n=1 Tax=Allokutzneria multivorans TaxID=1142134 RepID=A0ABP7S044_9PSEU